MQGSDNNIGLDDFVRRVRLMMHYERLAKKFPSDKMIQKEAERHKHFVWDFVSEYEVKQLPFS